MASSAAAYRVLADELRRDVLEQRYAPHEPLPTEAELTTKYGLSRQTVRRAFQDLVAEGVVYRVPGKGTFVRTDQRHYRRRAGSIEDLLSLDADTDLEIVEAPHRTVDLAAAGRLRLETDEVVRLTFRRLYGDEAFCVTTAYLPVPLGRGLFDVPELLTPGVRHPMTVLSVVQALAGTPIAGADQSITAVPAPEEVCRHIDVEEGMPVLRIDRVYYDGADRLLELAINHLNPARYSYRFNMRSQ